MAMVLLLGTAALAQPQGAKRWRRVERTVSVSAGPPESVQRLRLAPQVVTTVLFDSDVVLEVADPEALRGLFTRLELETDHLVLKPAVSIPEKGVPPLVVRFTDGAAPARLVLELTTDGDEVDAVVEVRGGQPRRSSWRRSWWPCAVSARRWRHGLPRRAGPCPRRGSRRPSSPVPSDTRASTGGGWTTVVSGKG